MEGRGEFDELDSKGNFSLRSNKFLAFLYSVDAT